MCFVNVRLAKSCTSNIQTIHLPVTNSLIAEKSKSAHFIDYQKINFMYPIHIDISFFR